MSFTLTWWRCLQMARHQEEARKLKEYTTEKEKRAGTL